MSLIDEEERWLPPVPLVTRQLSSHGNFRYIERRVVVDDQSPLGRLEETVIEPTPEHHMLILGGCPPVETDEEAVQEAFVMYDMVARPVEATR